MRGWEKASDHAPTWIELADATPAGKARRAAEEADNEQRPIPLTWSASSPRRRRCSPTVLAELQAGRKRSHWMWFVFPQLRGLGHSSMAKFYGIASLDEARAYLGHPLLGPRSNSARERFSTCGSARCTQIFGSPDDLKFHSSMTLFALAAADPASVFREALDQLCGGTLDAQTLKLLDAGGRER